MSEPQVILNPDAPVADKLTLAPGSDKDATCITFTIREEDHTLGNALRYMVMKKCVVYSSILGSELSLTFSFSFPHSKKSADVEYCGYSIPHPSECKINLRIQTHPDSTAVDALEKGLDDVIDLCEHVLSTFDDALLEGKYRKGDDVEI